MRIGDAEVSAVILINLLPHREMARQRARQVFNISLGLAVALGALIAAGGYAWFQAALSLQQNRNDYLTREIKKVDDEIK
jgi:type IV pilus assembly protein PilN